MPRFVLLYHDCPPDFGRPSHWDLMLESGDVLRTWALAEIPRSSATCHSIDAEQLADHRLTYLEYEGPVSGERGTVRRADSGTLETLIESEDCWKVRLNGKMLNGEFALRRAKDNRWTL